MGETQEPKAAEARIISYKDGSIGWMIYENRKKYNAVTYDMRRAIPKILADFESDKEIRVVLITGSGNKAFISGSDISQFGEKRSSKKMRKLYDDASDQANRAMQSFSKPMIAMIHGHCLGAGLLTAMLCDFRVASEEATFGVPPAKLGLGFNYSGVNDLVRLVGPAYASELLFTGKHYKSEFALRIGLINDVVPFNKLKSKVSELANMISANAPLTLKSLKTSIRNTQLDESARDMDAVEREIDACFASLDYQEGQRAFLEKRKPIFKGL
tara:strand:+ start:1219 stop:2031 length:813 start_codon:yes stop_codon:yes gene_type:complete